ncbi:hypothetical protein AB0910_18170 [Streptomyces sp. NPDC047002]|uniref:hypothetical protein n=1 Tax=Streptomyces sp. NPDC047002 TaxID=3155475 RepID=UPI003454862C
MRRTRTTTMLLLGAASAAMTAVSGCVSVHADGAQGPRPAATAAPSAGEDARPQIVQAPLREALDLAHTPSPSPSRPGPAAARPRGEAPRQGAAPAVRPPERPVRPEPLAPAHGGGYAPAPSALPSAAAGVCALGETYGHWPAGSAQARICHDTYGR